MWVSSLFKSSRANAEPNLERPQNKGKKPVSDEAPSTSTSQPHKNKWKNSGASMRNQLLNKFHHSANTSYKRDMDAWEENMKEHFGEEWRSVARSFERAKKLFDNAKENSQPEIPRPLLSSTEIEEYYFPSLPDVFQHLPHLEKADFRDWLGLKSLPDSILGCKELKTLGIQSGVAVPEDVAFLPKLETIHMEGRKELPAFIHHLDLSRVAIKDREADMLLINKLTERPLSTEISMRLEDKLKKLTEFTATFEAGKTNGIINPENWNKAQRAALKARMTLSNTLQEKSDETSALIANVRHVEQLIEYWRSYGEPITVDRLKEINARIGAGGTHQNIQEYGDEYGEFRSGMLALASASLNPNPEAIPELMEDLVTWIGQEKEKLHWSNDTLAKVQFATQAAQRFISLHPFPDGNARTMGQLMNWILQDFGLPPAALKMENAPLTVLPGLGSQNPSQDSAVAAVVKGMERTVRIQLHYVKSDFS